MSTIAHVRFEPVTLLAPEALERYESADEFIGPALVSEQFAINGREDEDYEWIWDAPLPSTEMWRNAQGYEIWALDEDFEPQTLILISPNAERCGFYMGVELWIDPEHRGQGLGAELVLAMTHLLGRSPVQNGPIGFSAAGYYAHVKAWELGIARRRRCRARV